jgi:hypothetical protein
MNALPKPRKQKPAGSPHWLRKVAITDAQTGEQRIVFEPADPQERARLNRRRFKLGEVVRARFTKPHDLSQFRRAHAIGKMLAIHVDGYVENADGHEALKRLQRESGIGCETQMTEIAGFGRIEIRVAKSIAWEEMPAEEFDRCMHGWCAHIVEQHFPNLSPEAVEEMAKAMPEAYGQ